VSLFWVLNGLGYIFLLPINQVKSRLHWINGPAANTRDMKKKLKRMERVNNRLKRQNSDYKKLISKEGRARANTIAQFASSGSFEGPSAVTSIPPPPPPPSTTLHKKPFKFTIQNLTRPVQRNTPTIKQPKQVGPVVTISDIRNIKLRKTVDLSTSESQGRARKNTISGPYSSPMKRTVSFPPHNSTPQNLDKENLFNITLKKS